MLYFDTYLSESRRSDYEQNMGDLQGKMVQTKLQAGNLRKTIESGPLFAARAESWWIKYILDATSSLPRKEEPYHILVTTHGGFIGALMTTLIHNKKAKRAKGVVTQRYLNTSVTIIEVDMERQGNITQAGDVSHLVDLVESTVENNVDVVL